MESISIACLPEVGFRAYFFQIRVPGLDLKMGEKGLQNNTEKVSDSPPKIGVSGVVSD